MGMHRLRLGSGRWHGKALSWPGHNHIIHQHRRIWGHLHMFSCGISSVVEYQKKKKKRINIES